MAAAIYDIVIEQGTNHAFTITMTNEDGTQFDLTDWTPRSMIRKKFSDANATAEFTCDVLPAIEPTEDIPSPVPNIISVSLTPAETAAIPAATYYWDLEIYKGTEGSETEVRRLVKGTVTVDPEVTK